MSEGSNPQAAKPGTACLGCRRRKLKCNREQNGCGNCVKADLPCVYPTPDTGPKRRRGPYKKDKPPREKHLEDLVRYLEPRTSSRSNLSQSHSQSQPQPQPQSHSQSQSQSHEWPDEDPRVITRRPVESGWMSPFAVDRHGGGGAAVVKPGSHSEELVKDALIALTRSSVLERETQSAAGRFSSGDHAIPESSTGPIDSNGSGKYPPARLVFDYWHLFTTRVDPLIKIIHCPTFAQTLFSAIDKPEDVESTAQTLFSSIYYAAVSTCTALEARQRLGESRDTLLQRYGRQIEAQLSDNYNMPDLQSLQALVLYIIAIRREDNHVGVRALFSLAVRMAQLIGLHEDPDDGFDPLEAELRRRVWWHLCGLESRGVEEGSTRTVTILNDRHVRLPANLNDNDFTTTMKISPRPRIGVTEMSYVLSRFECVQMVHHAIRQVREKHGPNGDVELVKAEQMHYLQQTSERFETQFFCHMDESRPFDWLCIIFLRSMLLKARLLIIHPFGQTPMKELPPQERFELLQGSVDIIRYSQLMVSEERLGGWTWFFRGWVQWHSLGIVIAELGRSTNRQFADRAWAVLDPILTDWDKVYRAKREEPAWEHVNSLIERARQVRQQGVEMTPGARQAPTPDTFTSASSGAVWQIPQHNCFDSSAHSSAQGARAAAESLYCPLTTNLSQGPTPESMTACFQHADLGASMSTSAFENSLDALGDLPGIDFTAFGTVFSDGAWDYNIPFNQGGGGGGNLM